MASTKRYSDLTQYFNKVLGCANSGSIVSVSALAVLADVLDKDEASDFRKAAISGGLVQRLINVLNTSNGFLFEDQSVSGMPNSDLKKTGDALMYTEATCTPGLPLHATLALQCLHEFCSMSDEYVVHKFVDVPLLAGLLRYITSRPPSSMEPFDTFFQYGQSFTLLLKETISSYGSKVKICSNWHKQYDVQNELFFYEPGLAKVRDVQQKSTSVLYVSVRGADCGEEKDLCQYLVDANVAWQKCPDLGEVGTQDLWQKQLSNDIDGESSTCAAKEVSDLAKVKWRSCCITNVLKGNFMWALIGSDAINTFSVITATLQSSAPALKNIKPVDGSVVVAKFQSQSQSGGSLHRARVVEVAGGVVTVFGVDLGEISKVPIHSVFGMPSQLTLEEIPAMASLVRLKGIVATPLDIRAVEFALSSFSLICRNSVPQSTRLLEVGVLRQLPDLINSPDHNLTCHALNLATKLTTGKTREFCDVWQKIVCATLVVLNLCLKAEIKRLNSVGPSKASPPPCDRASLTSVSKTDRDAVINACLTLLANRLFMSKGAKEFFYQVQGLNVVMKVFALSKNQVRLRHLAIQVLANFVHVTKGRVASESDESSRGGSLSPKSRAENQKNKLSNNRGHGYGEGTVETLALEEDVEEDFTDKCKLTDKLSSSLFLENPVSDSQGGLKQGDVPYYIDESFVDFQPDASHEFYLQPRLNPKAFTPIICGMLNTGHEGSIYLGLSEKGQVKGQPMSHDMKDEIRLGIDQIMMSKIYPRVLHSQFEVLYTPVVHWVGEGDERHVSNVGNRYVIEMKFRPVPKVWYCCNDDDSYYRVGSTTMLLTQQDVRHMIVIEEEAWHKAQIEQLQGELRLLRQ